MSKLDVSFGEVKLTPDQRVAVSTLCHHLGMQGFILCVKLITEGASGARVVLAEARIDPRQEPPKHYIFKIAPDSALRREIKRFEDLYAQIERLGGRGLFVPIYQPAETLAHLTSDDRDRALIYEHAGDWTAADSATSLTEVLRLFIKGEEAAEPFSILRSVYGALQRLASQKGDVGSSTLVEYYQDRWFPHYMAKATRAEKYRGVLLITSGKDVSAGFLHQKPYHHAEDLERFAHTHDDPKLKIRNLSFGDCWDHTLKLKHSTCTGLRLHLYTDEMPEAYLDEVRLAPTGTIDLWVQP